MPTIYSNTTDGWQASALQSTWNATHDAVGQSNPNTTSSYATYGVRYEYVSGRGGTQYYLARAFFDFDTSGITSNVASATFRFAVRTNKACTPLVIVKSGHDPSTVTDDWFSTWLTGQSITLSGWGASDVTAYSAATILPSGDTVWEFTLNSDALADLRDLSSFKICLMHYNDYDDVAPTSGTLRTGLYFAEDSLKKPEIEYTLATVATDNAVFFGCNF